MATELTPQVAVVSWTHLWNVARALMEAHAKEFNIPDLVTYIGPQQEILDVEAEGNIICVLASANGAAIGYAAWRIGFHPMLGRNVGHAGPWHITPEWRGKAALARRMLVCAHSSMRYRGVRWVLSVMPLRESRRKKHPLFGISFEQTFLLDLSARTL